MKRFGNICLSFAPLTLSISFQFIAMFFLMGLGTIFVAFGTPLTDSFENTLNEMLLDTNFNLMMMLLFAFLNIVFFGLIYHTFLGGTFAPNAKFTFHPLMFLGVILLAPGLQFMADYISMGTYLLMPNVYDNYVDMMENSGITDITLLSVLYASIFGPIGEEMIFRGATMRIAKKAMPFWIANILQAILFGAFHMNWIQGIYAAVLGLFFGFICEYGGSIYYSMLLHIIFNSLADVLPYIVGNMSDLTYYIVSSIVMVVGIGSGMTLFIIGRKLLKKKEAKLIALKC